MSTTPEPQSFVETHPLTPVGPAAGLFISGVSVFEITVFTPPIQRVSVIGINLPDPGVFGPFTMYVATVSPTDNPEDVITQIILLPTPDRLFWAGTTFLTFGGTLFPMTVTVRPVQDETFIGPVILEGPLFE